MIKKFLNTTPEYKKMVFQGSIILVLVLLCIAYFLHTKLIPETLIALVGALLYFLGDKVKNIKPKDPFISAMEDYYREQSNSD